MSEEFAVNLMNANKGFQVMERSDLNAILKEHNLASTGIIDPETAKKLGKLKAVDAIVVGTITPYAEYFRMTIKILDTETGMAMGGTLGNIARIDPLNKLYENRIGEAPLNPAKAIQQTNLVVPTAKIEEKIGVGDYCFQNNCFAHAFSARSVNIKIYSSKKNELVKAIDVSPNQTSCAYQLTEGVYRIEIAWREKFINGSYGNQDKTETKEIRVKDGRTDTIVLEY